MSEYQRIQEYVSNVKKMRSLWTSQEWDEKRQNLGREKCEEVFVNDHSKFAKAYPQMMTRILSAIDIPESQRVLLEEKENLMLDKQLERAKTVSTNTESKRTREQRIKEESFDVFMPELKASIQILNDYRSEIEKLVQTNSYLGTCLVIVVNSDRTISSAKIMMAKDIEKEFKDHVTGTLEKSGIAVIDKGASFTKWLKVVEKNEYRTYYPIAILYNGSEPPILAEMLYPWLQNQKY
jgi:cupin superfamily acireductone dioxygenase involved in methionine salvage